MTTSDLSLRFLLLDQLEFLRDLGFEVHTASASGPWIADVVGRGFSHHAVPLTRSITPWQDGHAFLRLTRLIRDIRPTIVHTHTPKASLLGQYAAIAARVPFRVHTIHGLYRPAGASAAHRVVFLGAEALTLRAAHAVLSQSREDLETSIRMRLCKPSRITYLGNGIDIHRFRPRPGETANLRKRIGLDADQLVVGVVARLVREKGFEEFFRAAKIVTRRVKHVVFVVVGPEEPSKADGISIREGIEIAAPAEIRYLGHRTDVELIYPALDVLVLPSYREGLPRAPMEAAACGIPSVVTNIRGSREVVVDHESGLLVTPGDALALADAIVALLADSPMRHRLGQRAYQIAVTDFDQRRVFERVAETYSSLMKAH